MNMGFFKNSAGGKDSHWTEWKDLNTGWGKTKYIGREMKTIIGFLIAVFIVLSLMGSSF
jgi:hypothetical protein